MALLALLSTTATASAQGVRTPAYPLDSIPSEIRENTSLMLGALKRHDLVYFATLASRVKTKATIDQVTDLSPVAAALLLQAERSLTGLSAKTRAKAYAIIASLAPDLPKARLAEAWAWFETGLSGIGPGLRALRAGLVGRWHYPRALVSLLARWGEWLATALSLAGVVLGLALLMRAARRAAHDLGDLVFASEVPGLDMASLVSMGKGKVSLTSTATRYLSQMVLVLICTVPVALGGGLLVASALWAAIGAIYGNTSERLAAVMVMLGVALAAGGATLSGLWEWQFQARGPKAWSCLKEYCPSTYVSTLNSAVAPKVSSNPGVAAASRHPYFAFASALALSRKECNTAAGCMAAARQLGEIARRTPSNVPGFLVYAGNVTVRAAFASCTQTTGRPDRTLLETAHNLYEDASISREDGPVSALMGDALVLGILGRRKEMNKVLDSLVELLEEEDLSFVARLRELTARDRPCESGIELMGLMRTPTIADTTVFFEDLDPQTLEPVLWQESVFAGRLSPEVLPLFALATCLMLVLFLFAVDEKRLGYVCPRCSLVTCRRCNLRACGFDYCPVCLLEQVRPAFIDSLDVVASRKGLNRRIGGGLRRLLTRMAVLVPGLWQLVQGRAMTGALLLLWWCLTIAAILHPSGMFVDVGAFSGTLDVGLAPGPLIFMAGAYLLSLLEVRLHRRT